MSNPVDVCWYDSTMNGAPVLTGEVNKLIDVIHACLTTGFGSKTLSSLVVASGVATATVSAGHQLLDHVVVLVESASPSGLNGKKRITVVNSTTFTFDATGISDQTATGTITAKVAPQGSWSRVYTGTNKSVFQSQHIAATGRLLWLDDSGTTGGGHARVRGYETMSDVDTGSGPFPTEAQQSGGGYWYHSDAATSAVRGWALYADDAAFILAVNINTSATQPAANFFGDIISDNAGDAFHALLTFGVNTTASNTSGLPNFNTTNGHALARNWAQSSGVGAIQPKFYGSGRQATGMGYAGTDLTGNTKIYISPVLVWDTDTLLRGRLPGIYAPLHPAGALTQWAQHTNFPALPGRTLRVQKLYQGGINYAALIDITGPWR